ncbi:MAG TPA: DNA-directed RNA polymerase subunit beta, partial [Alphaproteobacteria bacterium]|nr:DNA-directed RNA polymerase subunit beta [Alphaproteobacteria bacterium]
MAQSFTGRKRIRKSFGSIAEPVQMPNLIEVQRNSYNQFLQVDNAVDEREDAGLQGVFKSVFPISDFAETASLEFVKYEFEEPKYDVEECQQRDMTYAAPLKLTLRLIVFDVDEDTGAKSVKDIKEQDVFMGDMPMMTNHGTFVINGTERVIVSQMHRSPGVFFDHDKGKSHSSGKLLFAARVIPYRGSWLDFEFDIKDIVNVRIDRRRKMPVTTLFYALGMSSEEILDAFYDTITYTREKRGWRVPFVPEKLRNLKVNTDLVDADSGEVVLEAGTKFTPRLGRKLAERGVKELLVSAEELDGRFVACDMINEKTGEIYVEAGEELTPELIERLEQEGITELVLLDVDGVNIGAYMRNTMIADKNETRDEALVDIYRVMRPGEPPTLETAEGLFSGLFFDPERYDLSSV